MTEKEIVNHLSRKYNLTIRETQLYYEVYWKKFVLKKINMMEHDAIEILNLGVFVPKLLKVKFFISKYFAFRRYRKAQDLQFEENRNKLLEVDNTLRKLIKLKRLLDKGNEGRYKKRLR